MLQKIVYLVTSELSNVTYQGSTSTELICEEES